jgi:hypothetical protein
MNTMNLRSLALLAVVAAPVVGHAQSNSPWLPIPGQFSISVVLTDQRGDDAYIGSNKTAIRDVTGGGASSYKRSGANLRLDYAVADAVSLDATLSRSRTDVGAADSDNGTADSAIGLRWRVLDEFETVGVPTVTLRGAAIIKGNYDGARLAAIGKAASGFEFSVIAGKQVTPSFALWGEAGIQNRDNSVPNATSFGIGTRWNFAPAWSLGFGYNSTKYDGNLDIGGPGFAPYKFQQVREERGVTTANLGWAFAKNQGVSLSLGKLNSGRNTVADDQIVGVSYTYAFQ